jgi:predicted homoserine dehydrogenase-like protein
MGVLRRLADLEAEGRTVSVGVAGAGFMGRGVLRQLEQTAGLTPVIVVNRSIERGVKAWTFAGRKEAEIVVSDDPAELERAVAEGRPTVSTMPEALFELPDLDVVIEATGALAYGAQLVLGSLSAKRHVVSLNAELDATLGVLLREHARSEGVVYTIADGDQPGVLLRQLEFLDGMGFEVVAAVNCKANLDVHQNPDDSRPYAERDGTSVLMTTAFGDGTKMQIENAVVANLSGLAPTRRGMIGVRTTLVSAADDIARAVGRTGVVEYTLGGDFAGGVCVIGRSDDPDAQAYMRYSKMGAGPNYLFYRPYHLIHFEVPTTIAQVYLDREPLGRPLPTPVAEVVALAKLDLEPGTPVDGIGGFCCYGHIDGARASEGLLPIGIAHHARVVRPVRRDSPIPLDAVEIDDSAPLVDLRRRQETLVSEASRTVSR